MEITRRSCSVDRLPCLAKRELSRTPPLCQEGQLVREAAFEQPDRLESALPPPCFYSLNPSSRLPGFYLTDRPAGCAELKRCACNLHCYSLSDVLFCDCSSPAVQSCNIRCMNGGSCAEDSCTCPKGYTGSHCGQRESFPPEKSTKVLLTSRRRRTI